MGKKIAQNDFSEVILRHNALTRLARRAFCHISDRSIYPLEAETHRKDISPVMQFCWKTCNWIKKILKTDKICVIISQIRNCEDQSRKYFKRQPEFDPITFTFNEDLSYGRESMLEVIRQNIVRSGDVKKLFVFKSLVATGLNPGCLLKSFLLYHLI